MTKHRQREDLKKLRVDKEQTKSRLKADLSLKETTIIQSSNHSDLIWIFISLKVTISCCLSKKKYSNEYQKKYEFPPVKLRKKG